MFTGVNRDLAPQRIKSAVAVACLHVARGYAFMSGLGVEMIRETSERLKLIDIVQPAPPQTIDEPAPEKASRSAE